MFSGAPGRGLLTMVTVVVVSACSDLGTLQRAAAGAFADTTPAEESVPAPSRAPEKAARPSAEVAAASFGDIRRTLRRLAAAEEAFFAENGTYSDELSLVRATPGKDVKLRFLWLSREGWAASGTHTALTGLDCVIFVGKAQAAPTTLKYVRSGPAGVPVCDDNSPRGRRSPAPSPRAAAPESAPPAEPAETVSVLNLLDPRVSMKVDLRNLAHSQETYLAMQGSYARRTEPMALQYLWHPGVQVKILSADNQSWAAKATHPRFPGKSCVIWYGPVAQRPKTDGQQLGTGRSGVPICDD
jgi:hypothetical protein